MHEIIAMESEIRFLGSPNFWVIKIMYLIGLKIRNEHVRTIDFFFNERIQTSDTLFLNSTACLIHYFFIHKN